MAKKLWGGRFKKKTDPLVEEFSKSIDYDNKLAKYDLVGTAVHTLILKEAGFITKQEFSKFKKALEKIRKKIDSKDGFKFDPKCEDIHTNIQNMFEKEIGNLVLKLHTARSRNDQVLFDLKSYCKTSLSHTVELCGELMDTLLRVSKKNKDIHFPGYTHLQHAQIVYLHDYLEAYAEMLKRDAVRLNNVESSIKLSMGAGALSGVPINKDVYVKAIQKVMKFMGDYAEKWNAKDDVSPAIALDTVSDRDFVIEALSALAILGMHLSRISEELIIWSTKEFGFVEMDDAFATGSSLMPQKKNPDVLELIRGHAGTLYGNLMSVLTMMKGLPLSYNRDMQLDKPPLFSSFEIITKELKILPGLIKTIKWNKGAIAAAIEKDETLYATDLVYHLIEKGVPFKKAHDIIGRLVKYSLDSGKRIKKMSDNDLGRFSDKLKQKDIIKIMNPSRSVKSRISVKRKP